MAEKQKKASDLLEKFDKLSSENQAWIAGLVEGLELAASLKKIAQAKWS